MIDSLAILFTSSSLNRSSLLSLVDTYASVMSIDSKSEHKSSTFLLESSISAINPGKKILELEIFKYLDSVFLYGDTTLVELTIEIPDELEKKIGLFSDIELSLLVSRLIKERLESLARLKRIVSKSKLSEKKASEISDKINESLAKRYEEL